MTSKSLNCVLVISLLLLGCNESGRPNLNPQDEPNALALSSPALVVLGTLQDGGSPHMGCEKPCCRNLFLRPATDRQVVCLGLIDEDELGKKQGVMLESTPDFPKQWNAFQQCTGLAFDGLSIFLTHAHMGHYSGLLHLGREALGAEEVPVYCMPRMAEFLQSNGPWSQLVDLNNIQIRKMEEMTAVQATDHLRITPIRVPHRDEFSETVGFRIEGPQHSVLFIPDIDKWERWDLLLEEELERVDRAYLDATFYDAAEVGNRDMAEIPHPFILETMNRLDTLDHRIKDKIHFIHFNHTNPCLKDSSSAAMEVKSRGFHLARSMDVFAL